MHPLWGLGFFIVVNRVVQLEQLSWERVKQPRVLGRMAAQLAGAAAFVGVFSYSLYLTHELVIMESWWFISRSLPPVLNTLLIVVPATIAFAWVFYRFCEKPYMRKAAAVSSQRSAVRTAEVRIQNSEFSSQPSPISDLLITPDSLILNTEF